MLNMGLDSSTDWHDPDLRGWVPVTHPEGCLYFHHQEKVGIC